MKRRILGVTLALLGIVVIGGKGDFTSRADAASPQALVAEVCWKLDPFIDVVRLSLSSNGTTLQANGRWTAGGVYSMPVEGAGATDLVAGAFDISLNGNDDLDIGFDFTQHWKLTSGANGTWFLRRSDGFTNTGTLTFLGACPTGSFTAVGPAAGL